MRALAEYVMRGPLQAGGVAALATAIPLLFWIGAAVVGLVVLRLGISQGLNIGLWALLPALGWAWFGQDPTSLAVLLQVLVMASVLRLTTSWDRALLTGSLLSVVMGITLPMLYPGLMEALVQSGVDFYRDVNPQFAEQLGDDLNTLIFQTMNASMAGAYLMIGVGMTMLARSWQASLYNPGGFRQEFHSLKMAPALAIVCVVMMVGGSVLGLNPLLMGWAGGLPLFLAGLGLVHGLVSKRGMNVQWLVLFYLALLLLGPNLMLLLVVVAFVDSWVDIRSRVKPAGPAE